MKNQIYRLYDYKGAQLEFLVFETKEYIEDQVLPTTHKLEPAIYVSTSGGDEIKIDLPLEDLDSLIDYLENVKRYVNDFKKKPQPITAK